MHDFDLKLDISYIRMNYNSCLNFVLGSESLQNYKIIFKNCKKKVCSFIQKQSQAP